MGDLGDSIGGLWLNESKQGNKYMSGSVTIDGKETKVIVFKNTRKKENERTPDYRIYLKGDDGGSRGGGGGGGGYGGGSRRSETPPPQDSYGQDDDVPF